MSGLLLIDKSAYARGAAGASLDGEYCLCAVSRLELLFSARSPADYVAIEQDLAKFRDLRMDAETFAAAGSAQRDLARTGRHRVPVPDLLIAACAQQHGADVVHVDRHFDVLSSVLHFNSVRL
jgi:predicted nucleic acid-binding protein